MPTLLLAHGFRFFFYSNETDEPAHIHVVMGDATGKIWLEPQLQAAWFRGFTSSEEKRILELVTLNFMDFKAKWHEYFSK
jgi:hypothetical protein